jgi:hypothetical protein
MNSGNVVFTFSHKAQLLERFPRQSLSSGCQDELDSLNEELNELKVNLESHESVNIREPPVIGNSKIICGHCHHRGHRNSTSKPCNMNTCPDYTYCGIKDKHQEYIAETNHVKILVKKTKDKIQNLENQLNSLKDFESQSEYQFITRNPRIVQSFYDD